MLDMKRQRYETAVTEQIKAKEAYDSLVQAMDLLAAQKEFAWERFNEARNQAKAALVSYNLELGMRRESALVSRS